MQIVNDKTVVFDSYLESLFYRFKMDKISAIQGLWELNGYFVFMGSFPEYQKWLNVLCLLSLEQDKEIFMYRDLPVFYDVKPECIRIKGFSVDVKIDPDVSIKRKKLNKAAKMWANEYCFVIAKVSQND